MPAIFIATLIGVGGATLTTGNNRVNYDIGKTESIPVQQPKASISETPYIDQQTEDLFYTND